MNTNILKSNTETEEIEIDLIQLCIVMWKKIWLIALSAILCASISFSFAFFIVAPKYESRAMMYVNNSSVSLGGTSFSISSAELSAASTLLDIYVVILNSYTTLEMVIEEANLDYTCEELGYMVKAGPVDGTEVFEIVATSTDPAEAELIVDTFTRILPERIADIVDGSSVRIVDVARLPEKRSSPSYLKFTAVGFAAGLLISCAAVCLAQILKDQMDNTVRDEEYLIVRYHLPILAAVPDMNQKESQTYGGYYRRDPN